MGRNGHPGFYQGMEQQLVTIRNRGLFRSGPTRNPIVGGGSDQARQNPRKHPHFQTEKAEGEHANGNHRIGGQHHPVHVIQQGMLGVFEGRLELDPQTGGIVQEDHGIMGTG